VVSPPAPRLSFLTNIVTDHLPQVLLTSNPRLVLQYIISVLLQLNIESSDAINSPRHQLNRTLLREYLLDVLNSSVHLTSLQSLQQMAFALHLITVSIVTATAQGCVRGQHGQGQGSSRPRPRPRPQKFVLEVSSRSRPVLEDPIPATAYCGRLSYFNLPAQFLLAFINTTLQLWVINVIGQRFPSMFICR